MKLTQQRMLQIIQEEIRGRYGLVTETPYSEWAACAKGYESSTQEIEDPPNSGEWRAMTFNEKQAYVRVKCGERPTAQQDSDGIKAAATRDQLDPAVIDATQVAADNIESPAVAQPQLDTASFKAVKQFIVDNAKKMTESQMYWLYAMNNLRMYLGLNMWYPTKMGTKDEGWLLEIAPEIDVTIAKFNQVFTSKFPPLNSPKMGYNFPAEINTAADFLRQPLNTIRFLNALGNPVADQLLQTDGILVTKPYSTLLPKQRQLIEKFELIVGYIGLAKNDFWVPQSFITHENQAVLQFIEVNAQQFQAVSKPVESCCREMEVFMNALSRHPSGPTGRLRAFGHADAVKIWKIIHNYANKNLALANFPSPKGQPNGLIALILGYEIYKKEIPWSEWVDWFFFGALLYLRFGPWVPDTPIARHLANDPWYKRWSAQLGLKGQKWALNAFMIMRNRNMRGAAATKSASLAEKAKSRHWLKRLGRGPVKYVGIPEAAESAVQSIVNRNETYAQYAVLAEQFYAGQYKPMALYNDLMSSSTSDTSAGGETTKAIMESCAAAVLKVVDAKGKISKAGIILELNKMITGPNSPIAAGYAKVTLTGCSVPDDLASAALRAIPGVGNWTADMWNWYTTWKAGGEVPPEVKEKLDKTEQAVKDAAKNYKATQDPLKGLSPDDK
jgi:hypothetical protein